MTNFPSLFRRASACIVLSVAFVAATPAHADTDYTDAWFGGSTQAGWGLAFTQADYAIYAQFFHYDANHNPVWFGGTIYRVTDGHYNGALYTVSGDYYGHMEPDLRWGTFGHPWQQSLCIWGGDLVDSLGVDLLTWLPRHAQSPL